MNPPPIEHLILFVVLTILYAGVVKRGREGGSFSDYFLGAGAAIMVMMVYILLKGK